MRKGKSGLFYIKKFDGSIQDISGYFDNLFELNADLSVYLKPQIEKWINMDFTFIKKSEIYQNLPLNLKIKVVEHLKHDYRYPGDKLVLALEILDLKTLKANQFQIDFYNEIKMISLQSRAKAMSHIQKTISEAKESIIKSKLSTSIIASLEKEEWEKRLVFLLEIKDQIAELLELDKMKEIEVNVEPIEKIDKLAKSVPAKLVLLYELGLYEVLKKRIDEKGYNRMDMARLIGYVIGVDNVKYINDFLTDANLSPNYKNYADPDKDNPYTNPAIKEMKRILRECNLEPKGEYIGKRKLKTNLLNKK